MSDYVPRLVNGRWEIHWTEQYGGGPSTSWSYDSEAEAVAFIDGYDQGARENM